MNDAAIVGVLQGFADLRHEVEHVAVGDRFFRDEVSQALAVDVFHHKIKQIARFAAVEDVDDVGIANFANERASWMKLC